MSRWAIMQTGTHIESRRLRALAALLALTALLALPAVLGLGQTQSIVPGLTVEALHDDAGPWEIRVLRIDRSEPGLRLRAALGRGQVSGLETLTRIIERETLAGARVVGGVNADFFRMGDRPFPGGLSGACVRDGELIATPRGRPSFYITADGAPAIEVAQTTGEVRIGEQAFPCSDMNLPDQCAEGGVQLFTPIGGWELSAGCVVARLEGGPLQSRGCWRAVVTEVVPAETPRAARGRELLIGTLDEQVRARLLSARVGDPVQITLETPPFTAPVRQAVGGSHVLVRGGEVTAPEQIRHPRTAAGYNEREIILVTVDGRQEGWSVGMSLIELAELMARLGCTEAVNLDGGGSTTAWAGGEVINRPSGGVQRAIANALLVLMDPAPAE